MESDDDHDAMAASERHLPSSSQKGSTKDKGKGKMVAGLESIDEENRNYESDNDDENLITVEADAILTSHLKRKLLAPQIFSSPVTTLRNEEYRARSSVFV